MTEQLSLSALFVSSFLAATLLPGGLEVVLFGALKNQAKLYDYRRRRNESQFGVSDRERAAFARG